MNRPDTHPTIHPAADRAAAPDPGGAVVTLIGSEGFAVRSGGRTVLVDAFYLPVQGMAAAPRADLREGLAPDLILITHAHRDHFQPKEILAAARKSGAGVAGPASVAGHLAARLPPGRFVTLEPPDVPRHGFAPGLRREWPGLAVNTFRTAHSRDHNSYLVEMPGCRFFHDGDNEDTRLLDPHLLGFLDALFIAPWHGSGWPAFIRRLAPGAWFPMHLSEEEIAEERRGEFLAALCPDVPPGKVLLSPGESYDLAGKRLSRLLSSDF